MSIPSRCALRLPRGRAGSQAERAQFALVERWRDRVLQESGGVDAFSDAYPDAAREPLASLATAAREERGSRRATAQDARNFSAR
jgi:ribosomal 50S subunit-associated protein YjgA (DUF615 family)